MYSTICSNKNYFRIANFHKRYDAACILLVSDQPDRNKTIEEDDSSPLIVGYPTVNY